MDEYQNLIFSICYKMTADYFASQDLTQDTFLAAFRYHADAPPGAEKRWLCRIATNRCIDYLRSAGYRTQPQENEILDQQPDRHGTPESEILEKNVKEVLRKRCEALKPPYDRIAWLYFYQEKAPAEIAEELQMNPKTVSTQIYRAREMLRTIYREELSGEKAGEVPQKRCRREGGKESGNAIFER